MLFLLLLLLFFLNWLEAGICMTKLKNKKKRAVLFTVEGLCNVNTYKHKDFLFYVKAWILRETAKSAKKCKICRIQFLLSTANETVKY